MYATNAPSVVPRPSATVHAASTGRDRFRGRRRIAKRVAKPFELRFQLLIQFVTVQSHVRHVDRSRLQRLQLGKRFLQQLALAQREKIDELLQEGRGRSLNCIACHGSPKVLVADAARVSLFHANAVDDITEQNRIVDQFLEQRPVDGLHQVDIEQRPRSFDRIDVDRHRPISIGVVLKRFQERALLGLWHRHPFRRIGRVRWLHGDADSDCFFKRLIATEAGDHEAGPQAL